MACSIFTCTHAYTHCTPLPRLVKTVVFDRHCKGKLTSSLRSESYYMTSEEQNTKQSITTTSKVTEFQTNRIPWNLGEYDLSWGGALKMRGQWICLTTQTGLEHTGLISEGDNVTMWHLLRDALTCPQHVFSEWDDISSQTDLLPTAPALPQTLLRKRSSSVGKTEVFFFFFCMLIQT